ncbi:MAG: TolC family protein [Deltaproteobacteria bacterium]|nr:TolC family protein [Deltaproteobacteria bacterium]
MDAAPACTMTYRALGVLVATAALSWTVPAAADGPLETYVAEVVGQSPSLRARVQLQAAAREDARAAGRWPDPRITVAVDRVPSNSMSATTSPPMVQYGVQQMVPWPGKLGFMSEAASYRSAQAGTDVETRRLDLALDAKRAYWMLALNVRRRQVNRANRNLAATLADATLGRYSTGVGGHHDVARAQVEVTALDVQHVDLEGERRSVVAMMNALRNEPTETPFEDPTPQVSPPARLDRARLVERALATRPELRGMRAMQGEAIAMASLERRERYPDVMAGLWYNQMIGMPDSGGAMIGATLPIFGYARQGHRAAAFDAKAEASVEDQAAMRAMIRYEVADAIVAVETAARQVDLVSGVALPRARESFQASLAGFGSGGADIVGVLDARRSLQQAELALAEAEIRREVAIAQLERAIAAPLGEVR